MWPRCRVRPSGRHRSWWGQGTPTDSRIPALLANAGSSFKWTLYYEAGRAGQSVQRPVISADLDYIMSHYANNPAYLHVAGKPVLFVYGGQESCGMADRWKAANAGRFYLVLKVFGGYKSCTNQPNSWHQYAPAVATDHQAGFSYSISPGFWRPDESAPRLARDLNRWTANMAAMIASHEPWQLITTWNEWGEGTAIEPATEWGNAYLNLGGLSSPTPTPSTTPVPTQTPTGTATLLLSVHHHQRPRRRHQVLRPSRPLPRQARPARRPRLLQRLPSRLPPQQERLPTSSWCGSKTPRSVASRPPRCRI